MQAIPVTDPRLSHPSGLEGFFNNSLILQPSEFKREPFPLEMDAWRVAEAVTAQFIAKPGDRCARALS